MVAVARVVLEQHGCLAVVADQHVDAAIVVVIACRQPACGKHLVECRACLSAHVRQPLPVMMEQQQRLLVTHLL
jgi:hypothetical protein